MGQHQFWHPKEGKAPQSKDWATRPQNRFVVSFLRIGGESLIVYFMELPPSLPDGTESVPPRLNNIQIFGEKGIATSAQYATLTRFPGRVAQLVRATGLHPVGRGFESLSVHQPSSAPSDRHFGC